MTDDVERMKRVLAFELRRPEMSGEPFSLETMARAAIAALTTTARDKPVVGEGGLRSAVHQWFSTGGNIESIDAATDSLLAAIAALTAPRLGNAELIEQVAQAVALWFGGGDLEQAKLWDRETEALMAAITPVLVSPRLGNEVSEGFALVPIAPTEAMLDASWKLTGESKEMRPRTHAHYRRHWDAMLAVSHTVRG